MPDYWEVKMKKAITLLALLSIAVFAQSTFTDSRDGKKYKTIKISNQTWMAQNLDYHGEDGYLGLCYGDNPQYKIKKPENCQEYGRLYDWNEAKKACPKGWHLPNDKEWKTLVDFAGGDEIAGKKLKAKSGWAKIECKWTKEETDNRGRVTVTNYDECATDEYGFSALPGGIGFPNGVFRDVGEYGRWWSASEYNNNEAYYRNMSYQKKYAEGNYFGKSYLYSVRCIKD
jgi:uncharacterized protein (TIGR02145 family)